MVADHNYTQLSSVRSALSLLTSPVIYLADLPTSIANWTSEAFTSRSELQEKNSTLADENLILKAQLQQFESLEKENQRLRDLLDSSYRLGDRKLIAELIGMDLDPYKQQFVINKGEASGVYPGQPVLDANAVMGQVTQVNAYSSTVVMLTDASHAIPVQVLRNGLRGIAIGNGIIDELNIPHLPINANIKVGDKLVTSGLGGHFPPGYPVATVTEVKTHPGEAFLKITASPTAHLDRVQEVLLVWMYDNAVYTIGHSGNSEKTP